MNLYHIFKKVFFHGFNIFGTILLLIAIIFMVFKWFKRRSVQANEVLMINGEVLGLMVWILLCIIFLVMTGNVQRVQVYYATPIAIPALMISVVILDSVKFKNIVLILMILQFMGGVYYYNKNFLNERYNWESYRLEKHADLFSIRDDLFLSHTDVISNFKHLGRIGRRGSNFTSMSHLENAADKFKFIYINKSEFEDSEAIFDKINKIYGPPVYHVRDDYFFRFSN